MRRAEIFLMQALKWVVLGGTLYALIRAVWHFARAVNPSSFPPLPPPPAPTP